jgi:hypothetical protein
MKTIAILSMLLASVLGAVAQGSGYIDGYLSIRDPYANVGVIASLANELDSTWTSYDPIFGYSDAGITSASFIAPSLGSSVGKGVDDVGSGFSTPDTPHSTMPYFGGFATEFGYDPTSDVGGSLLPPVTRAGGGSFFSFQIQFGEQAEHALVAGLYFERLKSISTGGVTTTFNLPNDSVYVWIDGTAIISMNPIEVGTFDNPYFDATGDTTPAGIAEYSYYYADFSSTFTFLDLRGKTMTVDLYSYDPSGSELVYDDIALVGNPTVPVVVPEPGTVLLAGLGMLLGMRRRRGGYRAA